MFFDSLIGKRLMIEKSTLVCRGSRKTLRPTLPKSVPVAAAMAVPFELGISWPASTTGRANANGLKKYPAGMLLVAVLRVAPGAQLGRDNPLFDPRYNDAAFESTMSIGRPDIAVTIPAICQFENSHRPAVAFVPKAGRG